MNQKSIIDMAHGAFKERADYEMAKILENILDPNTKAEKKRTLTIQMVFVPDSERQTVQKDPSPRREDRSHHHRSAADAGGCRYAAYGRG